MEAQEGQKLKGDAAFKEGRLEEAVALYTEALEEGGPHVATLCNRSLAALKLGIPHAALQDAEAALQLLSQQHHTAAATWAAQLAKAIHRKAEALAAMGRLLDCIRAYRQGLAACRDSPELHAALRLAAEQLPVSWLAKYWAGQVEAAQAPHPLSARDGKLIKLVPLDQRLPPADLRAHLQAALYPLQDEARDLLCEAWTSGRRPGGKAETAFFRAAAYLNAGNPGQALKDARFALVYGPSLGGDHGAPTEPSSSAGDAGSQPAPAAPAALSAWPPALALVSAAHEALADNVPAALAMQRAHELDPENEDYTVPLERLLRRIPEQYAALLQAGGAAALEAHLEGEREAAKPEFLRQRPKYYYYYEWMKKRIYAQYPELPEPVMDKLLALEANELDMVLQYPRATQITVERLLGVYREQGPERLETYAVPLLSWEDYQAIKEEGAAAALPAAPSGEAASRGRLLEGGKAAPGTGAGGNGGQAAPLPVTATAGTELGQQHAAAGVVAECGSEGDEAASEAGSIDIDELCELD